MDYLTRLDWAAMLAPRLSLPEAMARGTVVYLSLIVLLRIIPKREAGAGTVASMLFVVLVGGVAANGLAGPAESLTDTAVLVLTVLVWAFAVDWLSHRFPRFRRLVEEPPTRLVRDGQVLADGLRQEMLSEEDLKSHLRRRDVSDIGSVAGAWLEADGSVSVVKREEQESAAGAAPPVPPCACGQDNPDRPAERADDPDLVAFVASAARLRERLEWHREQAVRIRAALAAPRNARAGRSRAGSG
jgi:uncharacterized membrane protein YcaP (DUF421 family)